MAVTREGHTPVDNEADILTTTTTHLSMVLITTLVRLHFLKNFELLKCEIMELLLFTCPSECTKQTVSMLLACVFKENIKLL